MDMNDSDTRVIWEESLEPKTEDNESYLINVGYTGIKSAMILIGNLGITCIEMAGCNQQNEAMMLLNGNIMRYEEMQ